MRAFNGLHDQVVLADIIELADFRMIQRRDRLGFPLEALAELLLGELHGDEAGVAGFPYLAHASAAYGLNEPVGSELVAGGESHLRAAVKSSRTKSCACRMRNSSIERSAPTR